MFLEQNYGYLYPLTGDGILESFFSFPNEFHVNRERKKKYQINCCLH